MVLKSFKNLQNKMVSFPNHVKQTDSVLIKHKILLDSFYLQFQMLVLATHISKENLIL